jgi:hypothetical protein
MQQRVGHQVYSGQTTGRIGINLRLPTEALSYLVIQNKW